MARLKGVRGVPEPETLEAAQRRAMAHMVKPRYKIAARYGWPRGLTTEEAAAYVGLSTTSFLNEVGAGIWPSFSLREVRRDKRRKIWDRAALDAVFDGGLQVADPIDRDRAEMEAELEHEYQNILSRRKT